MTRARRVQSASGRSAQIYRITVILPQTLHPRWMTDDLLSSLIPLISHPGSSLHSHIQRETCQVKKSVRTPSINFISCLCQASQELCFGAYLRISAQNACFKFRTENSLVSFPETRASKLLPVSNDTMIQQYTANNTRRFADHTMSTDNRALDRSSFANLRRSPDHRIRGNLRFGINESPVLRVRR
jgi:hypothetical protein